MRVVQTTIESCWLWLVGGHEGDPRTREWALLDVRYPLAISALYLWGTYMGSRWMYHREAMKLNRVVAIHNCFLFLLSVYMCGETLMQAYVEFDWRHTNDFICPALKPGPFSPAAARLASVLWLHYVSKAYEFVDTLIMVLKKNARQITFLHVYHHATTFFPVWWITIKYGPGGAAYFCCALNSFIHIWMYGYYLVTGLGVKLPMLKPLITYSQMIQFLFLILQATYLLMTDCYRPRLGSVFLLFQGVVFFVLFTDFARKTYWKPKITHVKDNNSNRNNEKKFE